MKRDPGLLVFMAAILWLGLVGCSSAPTVQPVQPLTNVVVKSDQVRVTAPSVAADDLATLTAGNSALALDLYRALSKKSGNLFYSPYSISLALAMTYAGARGETAQQMASTLHWSLPQARLHPAFNGLDLQFAQRGQDAQGKDGKGFRLNIVNAIWGQDGYRFVSDFLNALAENYGAGLKLLDFQKAPEPARLTINNWVSDQTEKKIKDLIPPGAIDSSTRLVLTNAIYFNAAWDQPFDKNGTSDRSFARMDGSQVTAPMMRQTGSFAYGEGNGYQVVELPYNGHQLAMVILLPATGQFETFEGSLDTKRLDAILNSLSSKRVALTMPKFKYESSFQLSETLRDLGMRDAFSAGAADFSGMTGTRELYIGAVVHKTYVSVDEAGTEAAAATAVLMPAMAMPAQPVEMTIDRPFVLLIRDNATGSILFVGRVVDPSA